MLEIRKILVPEDYSPCSAQALRYALELSQRTGACLFLLHVSAGEKELPPPAADKPPEEPGIYRIEASNEPPGQAILRHAEQLDADLIVMGTHARERPTQLVLGSVAQEVVQLARCPVLTLQSGESPPPRPGKVQAILVPVDFSRHAAAALRHARELASLLEARLLLLHVVGHPSAPSLLGAGVVSIFDVEPEIEGQAKIELEEFFRDVEGPEVDASFHTASGRAAEEVVRFAGSSGCGLIVMATRGLTDVDHMLLGSTAEQVIRTTPCPVLTVKSFGKSVVWQPELATEMLSS